MKEEICCLCQKEITEPYFSHPAIVYFPPNEWKTFHYHHECSNKLPKIFRERVEEIIMAEHLRNQGYGYRKIAKKILTSKSTVFRIFNLLSQLRESTSQK